MINHAHDPELASLANGGEQVLARLFCDHADRLGRMVQCRLDPRLRGRIDPADILQESYLEVSRRLPDYLRAPVVSTFVWLRTMTLQTLTKVHRRHLGAKMRSARVEVSLHRDCHAATKSISPAARLADNLASPSRAVMREEMRQAMRAAFESMNPIDREILALRHFEDLGNAEVAEHLGIRKTAASNRYVRALRRLRQILVRAAEGREWHR